MNYVYLIYYIQTMNYNNIVNILNNDYSNIDYVL